MSAVIFFFIIFTFLNVILSKNFWSTYAIIGIFVGTVFLPHPYYVLPVMISLIILINTIFNYFITK
jgi:hypothetical protein